jgi:hypothetical protein
MAKTLAYLFADLHAGGGYPQRGIDDWDFSLKQVIDRAVKDEVLWVISLGDAVNSAKTHADAPVPLKNLLRKLIKEGVSFGYIDGNHDKRHVSWLSDPEFYHLDGQVIHLGDVPWMGIDFRPREQLQELLAGEQVAQARGLFMHQAWHELMRFDDVPQCGVGDIPKPVTMVATGDFHGACVVETYPGKDGQKVRFVNPGSMSMQNILEPGEKFFVAVTDDEQRPFKKVALKTRTVLRVAGIHTSNDLDRLLSEVRPMIDAAYSQAASKDLPESMYKPMLHVTYSSSLNSLPRRVEKVVQDRAHLFWTEMKPEKATTTFKANVESHKGEAFTPMSLLSQEIDPEDPEDPLAKDAHSLAQLLYHAKDKADVRKVAQNWVKEQLEKE